MPKLEHPVKIRTPLDYLVNAFKGIFMGIADVVPGVSGGTIALVMGIYDQLITSITRVDTQLLSMLGKRQFIRAARHLNLPFLVSLIPGILTGILCMSTIASSLLDGEVSRQFTFAVFFGMIAISAYLVLETVKAQSLTETGMLLVFMLLGLVGALGINQLQATSPFAAGGISPTRFYVFISAAIAICAMILPGISGSMILMILGIYHHIVALPRSIFQEADRATAFIELGIFACGALLGLMLFSRILKWLLTHFRQQLLATLTGIMLGALPVLFQAAFELKPLAATTAGEQRALVATVLAAAVVMLAITRLATKLTRNNRNQNQSEKNLNR